jgi:hypothetical protein
VWYTAVFIWVEVKTSKWAADPDSTPDPQSFESLYFPSQNTRMVIIPTAENSHTNSK